MTTDIQEQAAAPDENKIIAERRNGKPGREEREPGQGRPAQDDAAKEAEALEKAARPPVDTSAKPLPTCRAASTWPSISTSAPEAPSDAALLIESLCARAVRRP